MKKRLTAVLLAGMMILSLAGCGSKSEMSAATRDASTDNGIIFMDDEAVALAGSMRQAGMSEADMARADELRAMALAALDLVNAQRAAAGLPALIWSDGIESCALVRATEINSLFSHTRPNGMDWYTVNSDLMWGENLAKGYTSAEAVVAAWMASPGHAANILDGSFRTCSIAIYENNGVLYFAQEFGY